MDAGVTGETDRMGALVEVGIKCCNAGTDFARQAHTTSCVAGTGSTLEAHRKDIVCVPMSAQVQECDEVVRLTPYERVKRLA